MINILDLYCGFIQKTEAKVKLLVLSNYQLDSLKPIFIFFHDNFDKLTEKQRLKKEIFAQYYSSMVNDMINILCRLMTVPKGKDFALCKNVSNEFIDKMVKIDKKKKDKNEYNFYNAICVLSFAIKMWKSHSINKKELITSKKIDNLFNDILLGIKQIRSNKFYKLIRFKNNKLENHQNFYDNEVNRTDEYNSLVGLWHQNFSSLEKYFEFNDSLSKLVRLICSISNKLDNMVNLLNPFMTKLFDDMLTIKLKNLEENFNNGKLQECILTIFTK